MSSKEPKPETVQNQMKGLMEHAEKTHAYAKSIADDLGFGVQQAEEKPDAEAGPIGLIICRIGSVHYVLSRIDEALSRILAEVRRL